MSESTAWISQKTTILDPTGLHARPAVRLTRLAKSFPSKIEIRIDGTEQWVNAKSPNAVMKLRIQFGGVLHIRATGEKSAESIKFIVQLIENNFS